MLSHATRAFFSVRGEPTRKVLIVLSVYSFYAGVEASEDRWHASSWVHVQSSVQWCTEILLAKMQQAIILSRFASESKRLVSINLQMLHAGWTLVVDCTCISDSGFPFPFLEILALFSFLP